MSELTAPEPRVGIVIPAFQAEAFVVDAVRSALAQTVHDLQVVVVDDGSTDRTAELVMGIDDARLRLLRQPNAGVGAARNRGAAEVGGDLIAFLDADDVWAPNKLEHQLAALDRHPEWACVGTFMHHIDLEGRRLGVSGEPLDAAARVRVARAELLPCPLSSVLFRRRVWESLGGFDETLVKHVPAMVEDLDLMARLAMRYAFGVLPVALGGYRIHGSSGSALHFRNQRDGARFLRARVRAGGGLTWEQFLRTQRFSANRWRADTAAFLYRSAGLQASERRWGRAAVRGAGAASLAPLYTARRLRLQRGRLGLHGR